MIQTIVCDLDGSLMNPSSGLYVSKSVQEALTHVQKEGISVILNSARIFQGVYPLSSQIEMSHFGGWIISCNGAHCYDVRNKKTLFEYTICFDDVIHIWNYASNLGFGVGFSQPEFFVSNVMTYGFELDMHNCDVDYLVTNHPEKYLKKSVWKMSISDTKERIDTYFNLLKEKIEAMCSVKVVHSTDTMIDIIHKDCEKLNSVNRLLNMYDISWKNVSAIGDGYSDAAVLEKSGLGVTLENGCDACKKVADKIVPSCYEEGCLEWLKEIQNESC